MLDYIKNETEGFLCRTALVNLKEILNLLQETDILQEFKDFLLKFLRKKYLIILY